MISSDTMSATTEQWMQFYQQPLMDDHEALVQPPKEGSSDATLMITKSSSGHLTPTAGDHVFKPIRRRSRSSKRTPTTLLNANTTNFRALVQQFTGCPTTAMSSLGVHKGPITLNFKHGTRQHNTTRSIMPRIGGRIHNHVHDQVAMPVPAPLPWQKQQLPEEQLLLHQQQQLMFQEQQGGYNSFDYMRNSNILLPTVGTSRPGMEVSDGLLVGNNDFSFHDLTVNTFSNDAY